MRSGPEAKPTPSAPRRPPVNTPHVQEFAAGGHSDFADFRWVASGRGTVNLENGVKNGPVREFRSGHHGIHHGGETGSRALDRIPVCCCFNRGNLARRPTPRYSATRPSSPSSVPRIGGPQKVKARPAASRRSTSCSPDFFTECASSEQASLALPHARPRRHRAFRPRPHPSSRIGAASVRADVDRKVGAALRVEAAQA